MDVDEAIRFANEWYPTDPDADEALGVFMDAVEQVRAFCADSQVPAVYGTYAAGYQAARRDALAALNAQPSPSPHV